MVKKKLRPWQTSLSEKQFQFMRAILAAPSPVGLEGAMTYGVIKPALERFMPEGWAIHQFRGNAGLVLDTHPGQDEMFKIMVVGHADKTRMQVRSIGEDGKIWIDSDAFLPMTLIGNEVILFSEDPKTPGHYRALKGGTVEAIGAIHFADAKVRAGDKGIRREQLYLELGIHGEDKKKQIESLGIRAGDTVLLDRPIKRAFAPDTIMGAYLDNGLGCYVAAEVARIIAEEGPPKNIRCLFAFATHEEIGRFGSRVLARELAPDVIIGVDVNHDMDAAPGIKDKRPTPLEMGKGFTLSVGSIVSEYLNRLIEETAKAEDIPMQRDMVGRDTGTDGMAGALASIDAAATSIGFPIRNMHTISELGHTGDVLAAIHIVAATLRRMDGMNGGKGVSAEDFRNNHPRLDQSAPLTR